MQGWIEGFQESIDYIEENLSEALDIEKIARKAALSPFYYQRIFGAVCGMSVGDYIRARRMTLAAQRLTSTEEKVIEVALAYGYDSPDSFAKAFGRFHGITPSQAREPGTRLRSLAPMRIKLTMDGGNMLEYSITEKAPFTIVGVKRRFNSAGREAPRNGNFRRVCRHDWKEFRLLDCGSLLPVGRKPGRVRDEGNPRKLMGAISMHSGDVAGCEYKDMVRVAPFAPWISACRRL